MGDGQLYIIWDHLEERDLILSEEGDEGDSHAVKVGRGPLHLKPHPESPCWLALLSGALTGTPGPSQAAKCVSYP